MNSDPHPLATQNPAQRRQISSSRAARIGLCLAALAFFALSLARPALVFGQQELTSLYAGMRWRQIGPFRAGRVSAVAGIPGNPAVFYVGTPGGGVWQTSDGGTIWKPISDDVPVASIGALGVAPSDPKTIYFGTGDVSEVGGSVNQGNGMYKSTDSGKTWLHIGLVDSWHIGALWIHPTNPDIVVVAALGHTYARNEMRGIFKTTDGGATWNKTLYKDDATGAIDVAFDPQNPQLGFATLWGHYVVAGNPGGVLNGTGGGAIYKTTDGGDTWAPVPGKGLPTERVGRIGVAVAPGGQRVYAIISAQPGGGLYRSDDGGATWQRTTTDPRIQGSGYFSKVYLDPASPDIVFLMQTSMYRSTDGGQTFISYKGAPGGDDNHVLWIDPTNSNWMILGSDQGATISVDGGQTWTSWYNQPTGQIYHLSTDNRWPYWVYGTQQDSGSVGTLSRGDYGAITFLDWDAVGGYEFGYIVADPLNPNIVYAGGPGRGIVRIDRADHQARTVSPNISRDGDYRTAVNPPLMFSPQDAHALYEGTQFVLVTHDGGATWLAVSPDLTVRPDAPPKPAGGEQGPAPRTAINTMALSAFRAGIIWAGTTNGQVQVTFDAGKTWKNVSPPGLTMYSLVSMVEASHFDANTAYVAVDGHETNDFRPHIYRTHDAGATWQESVSGIPGDGSFVRVVREDPAHKGLLYAGTENAAYVSFDDGDHWQSLQLNMPAVSVRDLAIRNNDLVAATYGRAFWILDDVTPLRQISGNVAISDAYLFQPQNAIRVRLDDNQDTPFPPDMPAGANPPTGAILDYYLKTAPASDITIEIYDAAGKLVRQLSSAPIPPLDEPPPNVPMYWIAHFQPLAKQAGMNRAVWDLRYTAPSAMRHSYSIAALYGGTVPDPQGALVPPGKYEVRLNVNGKISKQPLQVDADPRVHVPPADFAAQNDLAQRASSGANLSFDLHQQLSDLRAALEDRIKSLQADEQAKVVLDAATALDQKVEQLEGRQAGGFGGGGGPGAARPKPTFILLNGEFGSLLTTIDGADAAPTDPMRIAYRDYCTDLSAAITQWEELRSKDLPTLSAQLAGRNLPPLPVPSATPAPVCPK